MANLFLDRLVQLIQDTVDTYEYAGMTPDVATQILIAVLSRELGMGARRVMGEEDFVTICRTAYDMAGKELKNRAKKTNH